MKLKITHETTYLFDKEVFLEPHYLRFKPKTSNHNKILSYSIDIQPAPISIAELTDAENNLIQFCWFEETTNKLVLNAVSTIEAEDYNPFQFILHPSAANNIPFDYDAVTKQVLGATLQNSTPLSKPLIDYGLQVMNSTDAHTVSFLGQLAQQVHQDFVVISRHSGPPYDPDQTFELREGSCRDLAWMSIQLLRYFGLAARFVSGYHYIPNEEDAFELHAWLETFLPGAGWFGTDPSQGIITGHAYVPVVSSASHVLTMPVSGTFRGEAISKMTSKVMIEEIT